MSSFERFCTNARGMLGIDADIFATLAFRIWGIIAGGLTVLFVPINLSEVHQGYYYTFGSLIALQVFFELGVGQVLVSIIANESAYLSINRNVQYDADLEHLYRLNLLKKTIKRWYMGMAILFFLGVSVSGYYFFKGGNLPFEEWFYPWVGLVICTSVNLYLSGKISVLEGFGLVSDINYLRLKVSIIGYTIMWVLLFSGGQLWSLMAVPFFGASLTLLWLKTDYISNVIQISSLDKPIQAISWSKDIFPMQWRIALSWIAGYFIFHLFVPLVFKSQGPEEAGRLGLTLTIFSAISTISMSWVSAKASRFSFLIAQKKSPDLIKLFKQLTVKVVIVTLAFCLLVIASVVLATEFHIPLLNRMTSIPVILCLSVVAVANSFIFCFAVFMRAHREEPMLMVSIVGGCITAFAAYFTVNYGALTMMFLYMLITVFIGLPWTIILGKRFLSMHNNQKIVSSNIQLK